MGPGIQQQSQIYYLDSCKTISIVHLCWLCTFLWHNHQECLHRCESSSARKFALSLPQKRRRSCKVHHRSTDPSPSSRTYPYYLLGHILATRRLKESYKAGLFAFAGNECTYLFVLSPQFLLREGIKKNWFFLGNSPKQRTPPTHPYGLGLT